MIDHRSQKKKKILFVLRYTCIRVEGRRYKVEVQRHRKVNFVQSTLDTLDYIVFNTINFYF